MMHSSYFFFLLSLYITVSKRLQLNFNYGWRFKYGDPNGPGPGTCEFEKSLTNMKCTGLERNPNRFNHTDCRMACCYNPECLWWQQSIGPRPHFNDRTCLHGKANANVSCIPSKKPNGLVGGYRSSKPNPPFLTNHTFSTDSFNDHAWDIIDLPHDFIANYGAISEDADTHRGYFERSVGWYRKHFNIPEDWRQSTIMLHFEGIFHFAEIYLNGEFISSHKAGYLGFLVRLDNATILRYSKSGSNVIAIRTDASFGSGHWYEGGGIWRNTHLLKLPALHLVQDGVFVQPESDGSYVAASVEVELHRGLTCTAEIVFLLQDENGNKITSCSTKGKVEAGANQTKQFNCKLNPPTKLKLWTQEVPTLYQVIVTVSDVSTSSIKTDDSIHLWTGFRTTKWNSDLGFSLNNKPTKLNGFSHHHSFAGVGAAFEGIERLHLFKVQASKALGASSWRMSHNPYANSLYKILDIMGVLCWDENRDYGEEYVHEMHDMVKRDRGHPSVIIYSFCNEFECEQLYKINETATKFRVAALKLDTTRPLTANNNGKTTQDAIDVQGFSHKHNDSFISFHTDHPKIPLVLSECCSCVSQRLATKRNPFDSTKDNRNISTCEPDQNSPTLFPYVSGSLGVWTLFDYFGEPNGIGGWPKVSCSFGQFDISGFPKPHAWWYVAAWATTKKPFVHLLDLLDQSDNTIYMKTSNKKSERLLHAVVTTPQAALYIDGSMIGTPKKPVNGQTVTNTISWSVDVNSTQQPGSKVEVRGLSESGKQIASHVIQMPGKAVGLKLILDVPSITTGTGSELLLDGRDTALVRAMVVDAQETLCSTSTARITFEIIDSSPGRVIGTGNGDSTSHERPNSSAINAFGGLSRGFVQVNTDCTSNNRTLISVIDVDGGMRTKVVIKDDCIQVVGKQIALRVSSPGLASATIHIPVSSDSKSSGAFAIARRMAKTPTSFTYLDDFQG